MRFPAAKKYRPDVLWFDGIDMKSDAQALDLYQAIRTLRPECVINSRIKGCVPPKKIPPPLCDYLSSGDNEILKGNIGFEWENPGSMNTSYGYNPNDPKWHSAEEIVSKLVQIVSKGGNYLLNVGPTPEGTIPQPCIDRLAEVGRWMDHNGEAIYGSSAWHVADEKDETSGRVIRFTAKCSPAATALAMSKPSASRCPKDAVAWSGPENDNPVKEHPDDPRCLEPVPESHSPP